MNLDRVHRKRFTLLELLVSITVVAILIMAAFQFFSTTQRSIRRTTVKREIFEDARVALDLISRDIECAYYGDGTAPFWHWKPSKVLSGNNERYSNGHLAFIADTPIPPNDKCNSTCEIKYQLWYSTKHDEDEGWILRSVVGNIKIVDGKDVDDERYNYVNNLNASLNNESASFTVNSKSSGDYQKLIPHVLDLTFTCYANNDMSKIIEPDAKAYDNTVSGIGYTNDSPFPSAVTISITLMDKDSWDKWIKLCRDSVYHSRDPNGEPEDARHYREDHQVTFSKQVFLGNRGQEDE